MSKKVHIILKDFACHTLFAFFYQICQVIHAHKKENKNEIKERTCAIYIKSLEKSQGSFLLKNKKLTSSMISLVISSEQLFNSSLTRYFSDSLAS